MKIDNVRVQQVDELNGLVKDDKKGAKQVEKKGSGVEKSPEPLSKDEYDAKKAEAIGEDVGGSKISGAAPEISSAIKDVKKVFGQLMNSMFTGDGVKAPKAGDILVNKDSMETSGTVLSDARSKGEVKTQSEVQGEKLLNDASGGALNDLANVVQNQQIQQTPDNPTIN